MYPFGRIRIRLLGKRCLLIGIFVLAIHQFSAFVNPPVPDPQNNNIWLNKRSRLDGERVKFPAVQLTSTPQFASLALPINSNINTNEKNNKASKFNRQFHSYEPKEFWKRVSDLVSDVALYPDYFDVDIVLSRLANSRITQVKIFSSGTCLKWLMELEGGKQVVFKPQLLTPNEEEDKICNSGHEQGAYEVAAFHLLRLMGSRAVPFVTGRKVDIGSEILPLAPQDLRDTIKMQENGTACIIHKCQYCDKEGIFCFPDGVVKGSVSFWIDQALGSFVVKTDQGGYYQYGGLVQNSLDYSLNSQRQCDVVRTIPLYNVTRYYMDLLDMVIYDHIIGNMDRKHTYIVDDKGKPALTILLDHGMAFCTRDEHVARLLLALKQCCRVRRRTMESLRKLFPTLKSDFRAETKQDQLYPLLEEHQLDLVLERMVKIFKQVRECRGVVPESILYDDIGWE